MILCPCGRYVKRRGLYNHKQAGNPACVRQHPPKKNQLLRQKFRAAKERTRQKLRNRLADKPPITSSNDEPEDLFDPTGDLFGDYDMLLPDTLDGHIDNNEAALAPGTGQRSTVSDEDESDEELDILDAETYIEVDRPGANTTGPPTAPTTPAEPSNGTEEQPTGANRLRGGVDEPLRADPFVERFPKSYGAAGKTYGKGKTGHTSYGQALPSKSPTNPYAPFASKIDWEIAKWAKLRGPGSTAFTELMQIENVRLNAQLSSAHCTPKCHQTDDRVPL